MRKQYLTLIAASLIALVIVGWSVWILAKQPFSEWIFLAPDREIRQNLVAGSKDTPIEFTDSAGIEIHSRSGGPFVLDIFVGDRETDARTTLRATFKDSARVYVNAERVGQKNVFILRDNQYEAQWQREGAEVLIPDETYLFQHELTGNERDPLRFKLHKDLGWCWVSGTGYRLRNNTRIPIPPMDVNMGSRYEIYALTRSREWLDRARGAWMLGCLDDREARETLQELMEDPIWYVRRFAVLALGQMGDPRDITGIIARASDPDPDVQRAAVKGLGSFDLVLDTDPGKAVLKLLEEKIRSPDRWMASTALRVLMTLDPEKSKNILREQLNSANDSTRNIALVLLAESGDPLTESRAEKQLRSNDLTTALAALEALFILDTETARNRIFQTAEFAESDDLRFTAMKWVTGLEDEAVTKFLESKLDDGFPRIREEAARILNYRGWVPETSGEQTRYHFAAKHWNTLREMPDPDVEFLGTAVGDIELETRLTVLEILRKSLQRTFCRILSSGWKAGGMKGLKRQKLIFSPQWQASIIPGFYPGFGLILMIHQILYGRKRFELWVGSVIPIRYKNSGIC